MITVFVKSHDGGPTGIWFFESQPRAGEHVQLQPFGLYKVDSVTHWPSSPNLEWSEDHVNKPGSRIVVSHVGDWGTDPS